jgi:YesN/AraC family two-component response regulator
MKSSENQIVKVLIVDDEAGVRELLKDALKLRTRHHDY